MGAEPAIGNTAVADVQSVAVVDTLNTTLRIQVGSQKLVM